MGGILALTFLGCCALGVLVIVLFKRVSDLEKQIAWHRRHVDGLANQLKVYEEEWRARAAAPREPRVVGQPQSAPQPAAPEPPPLPGPARPRAPVVHEPPPRPPVRVPPIVQPEPRVAHAPAPPRPATPPPSPTPPPSEPPPRPVAPPVPTWRRVERPPAPVVTAAPAPSVPVHPSTAPPEAAPPARRPAPPAHPPAPPPPPAAAPTPHKPKADLELTIGTQWLSRIGMIAVLVALVFLVWYLYDRGYIVITREMVTGAGLLLGLGLMVGAEFAHRRDYEVQSQALTGGGAAVLYLTLWVGLHLYGILGVGVTFLAMALGTIGAACQALRHDAQTIAIFAWVAGYLVPAAIGEQPGGGSGGTGVYALFSYLTLLSIGVFVVAQQRAWPVFTGLALMGAHAGAAYIFRVSHGSLAWTLVYLLIITGGMMWVSVARREKEGANYGVIGAIAGYVITGVAMLAGGHGPLFAPYLYLLLLSGTLLVLGHVYEWPTVRWCAVVGSVVGLLLLLRFEAPQVGNWLLLYAALSTAGALASSTGRRESAEPLAVTSVLSAYGAAALFVWSPTAQSLSPEALFAYLGALAAGLLYAGVRMDWEWLPRLGSVAAFLATGLLYQHAPHGALAVYPFAYVVFLAVAVIAAAVRSDDRFTAGVGVAGAFAALPLTGALYWNEPATLVPTYLALAGIATLAVIEWRKWFGLEWLSLAGLWLLYPLWRAFVERLSPMPDDLAFTGAYVLIFLACSWVRHGVRVEPATGDNGAFMVLNALAFFGFGWYDLSRLPAEWLAPGVLAVALFALYLAAGIAAVRRCPGDTTFGPVLIGLGVLFLTFSAPLTLHGYHITVAWSLEAMALMALGFHYRSLNLRVGSLVVLILALAKAVALDNIIDRVGYQVILNSRALGTGVVIAALYVCSALHSRFRDRVESGEGWLLSGMCGMATALLLWVVSAETWCYVGWQCGYGLGAQHFALSGAWIVLAAALIQTGLLRKVAALRWSGVGLLGMTAIKVFAFDPPLASATYALVINSHSLPLVFIAGLLIELALWHRREGDDTATVLGVCASLLLFWVCCSETWMYVGWVAQGGRTMQQMGLSMVWLIFGVAMLVIGMTRRLAAFRAIGLVLFAATICKVFLVDPPLTPSTYFPIVNSQTFPLLIIAAMLYVLSGWYARAEGGLVEPEESLGKGLPVVASVLLWWLLTAEAWRFAGWVLDGGPTAQQYALSAVWTLYGAALVTVGLVRRIALYRWTAMTLFALTIVKVFIYDLASLSLPYRVLAFMGLGAVLIAVSFGYQRLVRATGNREP